jgi:hypothetical protein
MSGIDPAFKLLKASLPLEKACFQTDEFEFMKRVVVTGLGMVSPTCLRC